MQTLGYIKEKEVDSNTIYTITGVEVVNFMITRNNCKSREEARAIGQNLVDMQVLIPEDRDENASISTKFDENVVYTVQEPESDMYGMT